MKEKLLIILKWTFNSFIWLGVLILAIDIITKNIIVIHGQEIIKSGGIILIPNFLRINYLVNENIAFGISLGTPQITQIVFSIFAVVITGGIIFFLVRKWDKINRYYKACAMLIIAGALGNVIDRLFYSAEYLNYNGATGVVDWIDFYGIWGFNFNIADSAVVIAAFMIIIRMIVEEIVDFINKRKLEPKEEKEAPKEKVLSKTELEKQRLLEESKEHNDQETDHQ